MDNYIDNQAKLNSTLSGLAGDKNKLTTAYMAIAELVITNALINGTVGVKSTSVEKLDAVTLLSDQIADMVIVDRVLLRTVFRAILENKLPNMSRVISASKIDEIVTYGLSYDSDMDISGIVSICKRLLGIDHEF